MAKALQKQTPRKSASPMRTRQADIIATLEQDIASGSIRPNQRLDERELAERFGVSRTPVREALNRLVSSGVVEYRPRQGMFAAAMTMSQFFHMYEVMNHLEGLCASLCARRMSRADQKQLLEMHNSANEIVRSHDIAAYGQHNLLFHDILYKGSRNPLLEAQVRSLRKRLQPYRSYSFQLPNRIAESYREHERIVEHIMSGDAAAAEQSMRSHMDIRRENFSDLLVLLSAVLVEG